MDEYEDGQIILSLEAKQEYLKSLIGKVYKVLHLIEEEPKTGYSPLPFLYGQLFEINAANVLFGGKLVTVVVKLKALYDNYDLMSFAECKRQIFEVKKIIELLLKNLEVS